MRVFFALFAMPGGFACRVLVALVGASLTACQSSGGAVPTPVSLPAPPATVAVSALPGAPRVDAPAMEQALHGAVNDARQRERLAAVAWSDTLAALARAHSADMAARHYMSHISPDGDDPNARAARLGLRCRIPLDERRTRVGVLENLAQAWLYGSVNESTRGGRTVTTYDWLTPDALVAQTVQGWLDSPTHRVNLLDALVTREGLGVALRDDGAVYVTQVLC